MKIFLLGAGHIGSTVAALSRLAAGFAPTVADRDAERLRPFAAAGHPVATVDVENHEALSAAMAGHDAVINALPFHSAVRVATAACDSGIHYFDLTEDIGSTRAIRSLADRATGVLMPQCGLAPGFVGIVAHEVAQRFLGGPDESLDSMHLRVGALPRFPTNALKYNLTWSTDGLLNEYCNPCNAIVDGQVVSVPALDGLEGFVLDGVDYEAFNTSGGLGSLCETLSGKVRHLDYKSLRYPGHCALMKLLLNDLRLRDQRDILRAIFDTAIPTTTQDVVLVFVTASGRRAGRLVQESFRASIHGRDIDGEPHSAIQVTTAAAVLAAVDLVRAGALPSRGFIRQEDVPLARFRANRFGAMYFEPTQTALVA